MAASTKILAGTIFLDQSDAQERVRMLRAYGPSQNKPKQIQPTSTSQNSFPDDLAEKLLTTSWNIHPFCPNVQACHILVVPK